MKIPQDLFNGRMRTGGVKSLSSVTRVLVMKFDSYFTISLYSLVICSILFPYSRVLM